MMTSSLLRLVLLAITVMAALVQSNCQPTKNLQHSPQFHHTLWSADSGIGAVYDIQQAGDGFLWIQTSTGVFRFDGVRFQTVAELLNDAPQSRKIEAALPSHSSGVWFTTAASGLLLWRNGQLKAFPDPHCTGIIAEAQDGSLWVASKVGLLHVQGSSCDKVGAEMAYPGGEPAGLMMDHEGTLWVKTWTGDLLSLSPGQSKFVLSPFGGVRHDFLPSFMRRLTDPFGCPTITGFARCEAQMVLLSLHAQRVHHTEKESVSRILISTTRALSG
jgi:hypothetical protein